MGLGKLWKNGPWCKVQWLRGGLSVVPGGVVLDVAFTVNGVHLGLAQRVRDAFRQSAVFV